MRVWFSEGRYGRFPLVLSDKGKDFSPALTVGKRNSCYQNQVREESKEGK
jgi:hypothetical protein